MHKKIVTTMPDSLFGRNYAKIYDNHYHHITIETSCDIFLQSKKFTKLCKEIPSQRNSGLQYLLDIVLSVCIAEDH